jgi:hypothetical protein
LGRADEERCEQGDADGGVCEQRPESSEGFHLDSDERGCGEERQDDADPPTGSLHERALAAQ